MAELTTDEVRTLIGTPLTDLEAQGLADWYAALSTSLADFPHADLEATGPPLRSTPGPRQGSPAANATAPNSATATPKPAPTEAVTADLHWLTIAELAPLLRSKHVSPVEVTEAYLQRIQRFNPTLAAYITVMADTARAQALEAEAEIRQGHYKGPLHGVPLG